MTTLKDRISDAVREYHNEKDVAPDPEVLIENIMDIISDEVRDAIERLLR